MAKITRREALGYVVSGGWGLSLAQSVSGDAFSADEEVKESRSPLNKIDGFWSIVSGV